MTISTTASGTTIAGNGATAVFNYSFIAGAATNIVVTYTDASGSQTALAPSQYTLSINAAAAGQIWGVGGTVTYPTSGAPIAVGTFLTIQRIVPITQIVSISNQGDFYPQAVEQALDALCMEIQQVSAAANRAILFNVADNGPFATLPTASVRAGKIFGFDSSGNPGVFLALPSGSASSAMAPVIEAASTQAAVALLNYLAPASGAAVRRLSSKLNDIISVKDFGALGDGASDDTEAIQAAINAAGSTGSVFFPSAKYYVAGALTASGGCSLIGADAVLLGPTSGTATMLTISNVNNGLGQPYNLTHVSGLRFQVRGNYAALTLTNSTFVTASVEAGPVIENCHFTSWGYTSAGTAYLTSLNNVQNARVSNCSWVTYSANNLVGLNNALGISGSANCSFSLCQWNYCNVAITMGNSSTGQVTQGIRVIGCSGNGNNITCASSTTEDCEFTGCLFDNHLVQAFTSVNDLGFSIDNCYIGSSCPTDPVIAISCTAGNGNQQASISSCKIVQYVASTANALSVSGVSGTFYNGLLISNTEFRGCNFFGNVVGLNYVANSGMSECEFNGVPTIAPVAVANPPTASTGFRISNCAGLTPHGFLSGTGTYGAPAPLTTVGSGVYYQSPYPFDCMVYFGGSGVTGVQVQINGTAGNLGVPTSVFVPQGAEILVGFTGSPTWQWFGM